MTPGAIAPVSTKKTKAVVTPQVDKLPEATAVDKLRTELAVLRPKSGKLAFLTPSQVAETCQRLKAEGLDVQQIGSSRKGAPIHSIRVGHGPITLAAIAAAHPDEPMGTATALHLAETIAKHPKLESLRERMTLHIVPLADPDGSARNAGWTAEKHSPLDLSAYFSHVSRSSGGDDTEYAFPTHPGGRANAENMAIASWLDDIGGIDHFVSLHSIFLSGGAWYLVNAADRRESSTRLRFLLDEATHEGLPLHDEEDSSWFGHIAPGLSEAPQASRLGFSTLNSMEYARKHCGAKLALVTELPICFAPEMSSTEVLSKKATEAALRSHGKLNETANAATRLANDIGRLQLTDEGAEHLSRYRALVGRGHREGALPGGQFTKGDQIYAECSLARRTALYLGAARSALVGAQGDGADELRGRIETDFQAAVTKFSKLHKLKRAPLETQCHLQMAAVLSGTLPMLSGQ